MIKGVDISSWQKNLDVKTLSARGFGFAIAKISEGQSWVDPCFDRFYSEAGSIDLPFGAYIYSHACTEAAARAEAAKALELLRGRPLRLGVWLDVEDAAQLNTPNLGEIVAAFCDEIRKAGYKTGAYGSAGQLWARVSPSNFNGLVWAASWGLQPRFSCDVWQYTDHLTVEGYSGPVDGDYAMSERFEELLRGEEEKPQEADEDGVSFTLTIPVLQYGDFGDDVKALQGELLALGYSCGGKRNWQGGETPDGIFGNVTKASVAAIQRKNGLADNGIVGPKTRRLLLGV